MYAVVEFKGHQHIVKEGDVLTVDRVDQEEGTNVMLDNILLTFEEDGSKVTLGKPYIKGKVEAEVSKQQQGDKVRILKFRRKNRYQRTLGFRAKQTVLLINKIHIDG
jgi:large subunit ribosomal protein L21